MPNALPYAEYVARKPFRRWHEPIIDDLLARPLDTLRDRSARLGYTEAGLGQILRSDMFKAAYKARHDQFAALLNEALVQKLGKLADTGLTVMQEALEKKRDQLPFAALTETTMSVLEKLGFGADRPTPATVVNIQNNNSQATLVPVSAERLQEARERLRSAESAHLAPPQAAPSVTFQASSETKSPSSRDAAEAEILPPEPREG